MYNPSGLARELPSIPASRSGAKVLRPAVREAVPSLPGMLGTSKAMRKLARIVERTARINVPVLLRGESGSGKDLAARALHGLSRRSAGPFVAVNGASLTETMAASALFGHVRGAFTGALEARLGAFRQANGGTLFIDEVAAIPSGTQALLLRTLETLVVQPVGGDGGTLVNVRVLTATCEDLEGLVRAGTFRADLYQRIAACIIRIPPLRQRQDDLQVLAELALADVMPSARLAPRATQVLRGYSFPGNVRELRNIVLQAAVSAERPLITGDDLERIVRYRGGGRLVKSRSMVNAPDAQLLALFEQFGRNASRAARAAGLPRSTFRDRIRRAERNLR